MNEDDVPYLELIWICQLDVTVPDLRCLTHLTHDWCVLDHVLQQRECCSVNQEKEIQSGEKRWWEEFLTCKVCKFIFCPGNKWRLKSAAQKMENLSLKIFALRVKATSCEHENIRCDVNYYFLRSFQVKTQLQEFWCQCWVVAWLMILQKDMLRPFWVVGSCRYLVVKNLYFNCRTHAYCCPVQPSCVLLGSQQGKDTRVVTHGGWAWQQSLCDLKLNLLMTRTPDQTVRKDEAFRMRGKKKKNTTLDLNLLLSWENNELII